MEIILLVCQEAHKLSSLPAAEMKGVIPSDVVATISLPLVSHALLLRCLSRRFTLNNTIIPPLISYLRFSRTLRFHFYIQPFVRWCVYLHESLLLESVGGGYYYPPRNSIATPCIL